MGQPIALLLQTHYVSQCRVSMLLKGKSSQGRRKWTFWEQNVFWAFLTSPSKVNVNKTVLYLFTYFPFIYFPLISIKRESIFCLRTFICTESLTMVLTGFSLHKCLDTAKVPIKGAASFHLWLTKKKNRHSLPLASFSIESCFLPTSLWIQSFFYFFLVEECSFICPLIHFQSLEEMNTELRWIPTA